jgi:predicted negative regulator of RcsB-dependent stress response
MKNAAHIKEKIVHYLDVARKNAPIVFFVFLVAIYGFLAWRITQLMQAEPSSSDVTAQLQSVGVPKVDPTVVQKMEDLKDNNISVQALFDNARSNPFQE